MDQSFQIKPQIIDNKGNVCYKMLLRVDDKILIFDISKFF